LNANGSKDTGESGLSGVTLFLDANNNGVLDTGERSTTTDASRSDKLREVAAGTYLVREAVPSGLEVNTGNRAVVVLGSGSTITGVNFCNFNFGNISISTTISISGQAFRDLNVNGVKDAGEPGLSGVTLFLDANNNGVLDTGERSTTTDAS